MAIIYYWLYGIWSEEKKGVKMPWLQPSGLWKYDVIMYYVTAYWREVTEEYSGEDTQRPQWLMVATVMHLTLNHLIDVGYNAELHFLHDTKVFNLVVLDKDVVSSKYF